MGKYNLQSTETLFQNVYHLVELNNTNIGQSIWDSFKNYRERSAVFIDHTVRHDNWWSLSKDNIIYSNEWGGVQFSEQEGIKLVVKRGKLVNGVCLWNDSRGLVDDVFLGVDGIIIRTCGVRSPLIGTGRKMLVNES